MTSVAAPLPSSCSGCSRTTSSASSSSAIAEEDEAHHIETIWGSECLLAPSGRSLALRAQAARKPRRHPPRARRIHLSPAVSLNELRCDPSPLPGSRISETRETTEGSAELEFRIQFPPADSPSLSGFRLRPGKDAGFPPFWRPCGAAVSSETRKVQQHRAEEG